MKSYLRISHISEISLVLILVFALFLNSCKTNERIVEVEKEVVKTEYQTNHTRDSIYLKDSVYLERRNDTVFLTKYQNLYRDRIRVDTLFRTDSIRKTEIVIKTINKLTKWQEWRLKIFRWLVLSVILLIVYTFRKQLIKIIR